MRIYPINNFKYHVKNSKRDLNCSLKSGVGFQGRVISSAKSWQDNALDFLIRNGDANFIELLEPQIVKYGLKLAVKYNNFEFGEKLSNSLYMQYMLRKKDYSDFINKFRDCLIVAEFVSFARVLNDDQNNEKSFANSYVADNLGYILSASEILGEDTICYATSLKRKRFEKLLFDIVTYHIEIPREQNNILLLKTNPRATSEYNDLEEKKNGIISYLKSGVFKSFHEVHGQNKIKIKELLTKISNLKQSFSIESKQKIKEAYSQITEIRRQDVVAKPEKFLKLEKQLTEIKAQQSKMIKNGLTDPQQKIELFYLYKLLRTQNPDNAVALDLLLADYSKQESEMLKSHIKLGLQTFLKLSEREIDFLYNSGIEGSPYLYKILEANKETTSNIKELISLLANSDMSIKDTLNNLEQNRVTKQLFESQGYNYDAWVGFDAQRDMMILDANSLIRKVDMDDIKHSLFLGNFVGCCTAIGSGSKTEYATSYIINKFIQAIELVVDNKPVGNTLCYLVEMSSGGNALILDNMEVLPPYNDEEKYLKAFLRFARRLSENIGSSDMPIFVGHRNKFKLEKKNKIEFADINIIGSSGKQVMYIDSISGMMEPSAPIASENSYQLRDLYELSSMEL